MVGPEIVLAVLGVLGAGWGISRSGAVAGWRSVADARKERLAELESSLVRAEDQIGVLNRRITELEGRPDLRAVEAASVIRHAEGLAVMNAMLEAQTQLKEAVDALAERWG